MITDIDSVNAGPQGRSSAKTRAGLRTLVLRFVVLTAVSGLACELAYLVGGRTLAGMPFFPGAGLAFGFGWRYGSVWVFPAALGVCLWAAFTTGSAELVIGAALVTLAGSTLSLVLLRQFNQFKPSEFRLEAALRLLVCVVLISAPINAVIAALALHVSGIMGDIHPIHQFLAWWLRDALGTLLVAPAIVTLRRTSGLARVGESWLDYGAFGLTVAIMMASIALSDIGQQYYAYSLILFFIPVAAWTSIRSGERTAALSMIACAMTLFAARTLQLQSAPSNLDVIDGSMLIFVSVVIGLLLQSVAADRRVALHKVRQQARQDMTTGLLNDRGLLAELGERLAAGERPDYGLVGLHIANFDTINDLCGTMTTLQLEQSVARLLQRQNGFEVAARLTAGRYALLVRADSLADARSVAREVYSNLSGQMFRTDIGTLRLQACVGGLHLDRQTRINREDCMVSLADAQSIAASVRDPQLFVEPLSQSIIDARRSHRGKIEHIRESIRNNRFAIHAQPILDTNAPPDKLSYEILIRLIDPDGELIQPPDFLSLAVHAQITPAMDRGVIARVFEWLAANPMALARTHKCSINLSGLTMSDGLIAAFIREKRIQYGIPADRIVFEITESEAIRNPGAASRLVDELKSDGFGIALDDFGVGLATFEYLKRFPLDFLKIDGSFIRNLATSPIDEEIVLSTVRVARRLNIQTVAEHVQSADVFDRCKRLGVRHFQGEHLGRAVPIESFFETHSAGLGSPRRTSAHH